MNHTSRRMVGIWVSIWLGLPLGLMAQLELNLINQKANFDQLETYFSSSHLLAFRADTNNANEPQEKELSIQLPDHSIATIRLSPTSLFNANYQVHTASGQSVSLDDLHTYIGTIPGDPLSDIRLTRFGDELYGYIYTTTGKYYIEPVNKFISNKSTTSGIHVLYQPQDVKQNGTRSCGSTEHAQRSEEIKQHYKSYTCKSIDLAIAIDYSYQQDHGGTQGAITQSINVINMIAGSFQDAFSDDIEFEVVEHFVSDCSSCDPWTSSTDAQTLLTDFSDWGRVNFQTTHDLGQLWTNRDLCGTYGCGVAGLAWVNATCGTFRYHILEDYTTTAWMLRVLTAHEIGHNLGANHDGSNSSYIMAPSIGTNTTSWSNTSINDINAALTNFTCLEDCLQGTCSEISSISTIDCQIGSPSTYTLSLEIAHGGGNSSGFKVTVNGQEYQQTYEQSPQSVLISGLVADGTTDNVVTVRANDSSDASCYGTEVYDEPSSTCSLTEITDFDDCQLPLGWTTSSTNSFIWNSGDPEVQYEWKFADANRRLGNYDNSDNAHSSLTIDGTCMAIMDDDIFNHPQYTGTVTLQSPTYDMTEYDELTLELDYNYHPFEDGGGDKGPNNSYFAIEVYDGTTWIEVLYDNTGTCPWYDAWPIACQDHPILDLAQYINDVFSMRFIYSDGDDGKWAGMVAMDNILLTAASAPPIATCSDGILNGEETGIDCGGPDCVPCDCPEILTIDSETPIEDSHQAQHMIRTVGAVIVNTSTLFTAENIEFNDGFEIMTGAELDISNTGCQD